MILDNVFFIPSIGTFLWFSVFGGNAFFLKQEEPLLKILDAPVCHLGFYEALAFAMYTNIWFLIILT
jgi:choline-glycine betaine transporter